MRRRSVAFGRVYIGNTNGSMYSFSAADGKLAWRRATGNYIYSSAAVATRRRDRPDRLRRLLRRHALRPGRPHGRRPLDRTAGEGRISGGVQLLGDLVFYSTLNRHTDGA